MPNPHRSLHDKYIQNYLRTKSAKIIGIGREVCGCRKDGSVFPMRLAVSEVQLKDRIIFTGFIHDLSPQKEAEKQIRQLNEELEAKIKERTIELAESVSQLLTTNKRLAHEINAKKNAVKALRNSELELKEALAKEIELGALKTRFISMVSHEFRTPLSTILASAELINNYNQTDHPKIKKNTTRISNAVDNLTEILNDLLSLSKLEEGKVAVKPTDFDLYCFVEDLIEQMQVSLKRDQQILFKRVENNFLVRSDAKILKNILFNLFSNAIKYSKEGQTIECRVDQQEKEYTIMVVDQGIGIPQEDQKYLFTRFYRASNVENIQGSGLGLSIAKHYIHLLNGQLTFESQLGKGSTFLINLPIQQVYH